MGVWQSSTVNCDLKPASVLQKSRTSGMLNSLMAKRSRPNPNAQPALLCTPPTKPGHMQTENNSTTSISYNQY